MTPRAREGVVHASGSAVHYRCDGPAGGRRLLLIHGFLGSMEWFDGLAVRLVRSGFHILRVDLPGHGMSTTGSLGLAPADQARTLALVLTSLRFSPDGVIGHSLGADIAIALIEQMPRADRPGRLIVLDEGPDYSTARVPVENHLLRIPGLGRIVWRWLPRRLLLVSLQGFVARGFDIRAAFSDPGRVTDIARVGYDVFVSTQRGKERFVRERALDLRIQDVGTATLVVFGADDRIYDPVESIGRYASLGNVRTSVLEHAGHSPAVEAPGVVAEAVRAFFAESEEEGD